MPGLFDFMHVANTRDILSRLNRVIETRHIFPIFGEEATGKTRLIHYWLNEHAAREGLQAREPAPGLSVELSKTERDTISRRVYVTPITNVLFMDLVYEMSTIPTAYTAEISNSRWFQPGGKLMTDSQFLALFNFVRKHFKRLKPHVVVIDNAQLLDTCALERLMKLRNDMGALVLCITLQKNEKMANALELLKKRLPREHHRELALPDPALLLRMSPKEFAQEVFRLGICKRLDIRFPTKPTQEELDFQKRIVKRAWEVAGEGDWVSIENLYDRFRIALGDSNGHPRTLTPDILRDVFGTW
jgi:hypothetical protein